MRQKTVLQLLAFIVLAVLASFPNRTEQTPSMAINETLTGKVDRVVDGDSFYLDGHKLRLWGTDAPEVDDFGYEEARKTLHALIYGKTLTCDCVDIDRHGRSIAKCKNEDGQDIGDLMIRSGWALDYRKHTHGFYEKAEDEARDNKRGLWAPR